MTLRLCLLGNSHLACVRDAWRNVAGQHPGIEIEFFGAPGERMETARIEQGRLTGDPDLLDFFDRLGMRRDADIRDFDAFAILGCQVGVFHALNPEYATHALPSEQRRRHGTGRTLVSEGLMRHMVCDRLRRTIGFGLAEQLRKASDAPILICPQPLPGSAVMRKRSRAPFIRTAIRSGDAPVLADLNDWATETVFSGLATLVPQRSETVVDALCTADAYTKGSIRLAKGRFEHDETDILHTNAAYGALVIEDMVRALGEAQPRAEETPALAIGA